MKESTPNYWKDYTIANRWGGVAIGTRKLVAGWGTSDNKTVIEVSSSLGSQLLSVLVGEELGAGHVGTQRSRVRLEQFSGCSSGRNGGVSGADIGYSSSGSSCWRWRRRAFAVVELITRGGRRRVVGLGAVIIEYSLEDMAADADGGLVRVHVVRFVHVAHPHASEHRLRAHLRRQALRLEASSCNIQSSK